MLNYTINYIITLPDANPSDLSIFQGFSHDLLRSAATIDKILNDLPLSFVEFNFKRDFVIGMRMSGMSRYNIIPITKSNLKYLPISIRSPFYCIFSDEETFDLTEDFIESSPFPILHISTLKTNSVLSIEKVAFKDIVGHARKVLEHIEYQLPKPIISKAKEALNNAKRWKKKDIKSDERGHLITYPNEIVLKSMNFHFMNENQLVASIKDDVYVHALLNTVEIIDKERQKVFRANDNKLPHPPCTTLILSLPSMYRHIYKNKINTHNLGDALDTRKLTQTLKFLQQQRNYYVAVDPKKLRSGIADLFSSPEFLTLMKERQNEMIAYTYGVAVKSCNNFAPCLRLPPSLNTLQGDIIQLANCDRANSNNKVLKINRLFSRLIQKMSDMIDQDILKFIERYPFSIKIISDSPIEWINIRDLPLMIRFNTSRISSTPGNLFFHQVTDSRGILLSPEDLTDILVLRSFKKGDPIRRTLETAINLMLNDKESTEPILEVFKSNSVKFDQLKKYNDEVDPPDELDVSVTFVDVFCERDIINALDKFTGQIMIFDGHASHDSDTDIGSVLLGDNKLDVWDLKYKTRIPPIVILSACDTHPIDASHASTANGFLAAGTLSVLATVLPIDALYASIFIARLILRIKLYVPNEVYNLNRQLRWNDIISGLQRMNYVTEILHLLCEYGNVVKIDKDAYLRISYQSNMFINSNNPSWYEDVLELIAEESGFTIDEVKKLISKYAQFPESMKYIQMGNPDQILIVKKDMSDKYRKIQ